MENLTHTLTGLMMSRCGLDKTTQRGGAVMMMIAANIPDIDVVTGLPGSLTYLQHHREYTHSFAFMPVMAFAALLLAKFVAKARITWQSYVACLVGVLSHLLLDWTNVYGIRLGLPFSSHWFRLDITDVIDPWISAILLLALAAPALASLVTSEIGGKNRGGAKFGWAVFALVALLSYEGLRFTSHRRALALMEARTYDGAASPRFTATPTRLSPFRWRGIVDTGDTVLIVPIDVTQEFDPAAGQTYYPAKNSPAMDAARRTLPFEDFLRFNQVPFWRVGSAGDLIRVQLLDLRFGTPQVPGFAAEALVAPNGSVPESHFGFGSVLPR